MKNKQNDYPYDCNFEYKGKTIWVRVKPDNNSIRMVRGVEKMSGFFEFFDSDGNDLGAIAFYENFEDMTPVRIDIAESHYIELLKTK